MREKIAYNACEQLDSIQKVKVLNDSIIRNSITHALARVMTEGTAEEKKIICTVTGIRQLLKETFEVMPSACYPVRRFLVEKKRTEFYKFSDNEKANLHFDAGNDFLKSQNYKKAIKAFKSAIKLDKSFVYAIDHLAVAYRRQMNFKKAIKYYKQSLSIFPEGDVALLNIAVSYTFLMDNNKALECYNQLMFLYPNEAEGYFGSAKIRFRNSDYSKALDHLFIAHSIYADTHSDYIKDSTKLFEIMYVQLKEENKLDLVKAKAKEHNVQINVE
ncbi:tetratricopeptide repeat protein [Ancylomarina euxinus]|uniref:tetratricopeptide repeat protein n=1 Tax=Ancylomarina euxinus TaxID=2283627 RepID=UPI00131521E0|nr:tetratricopeptide repeat protein [Ancylomarina euxinus]MCZ4696029.1 tetratricopeptide repeat protein [Ancylomarina euxinus]